jgi:hypothetical protein
LQRIVIDYRFQVFNRLAKRTLIEFAFQKFAVEFRQRILRMLIPAVLLVSVFQTRRGAQIALCTIH